MIFTLQPGVAATLPAQLLSVRLQLLGSAILPELDALALDPDAGEQPITDLVRHPGRLALAVGQPTMIRIRPPQGQASFGPGSVYGLVVGPETADSDQANLKSVDASGLAECRLVTMTPKSGEILVTAVAQSAHVALPPAADQARVAARQVIGAPSVARSEAVEVRVVIDSSASLRQIVASGWPALVVEIISGAATVVSDLAMLPVAACGRSLRSLPDHRFDLPGSTVIDELVEVLPSVGFRSALVPDGGGRGMTYLITDALPADYSTGRRDLVHLVILGGGDDDVVDADTGVTYVDVSEPSAAPSNGQLTALTQSILTSYQHRVRERRGA